LVFKNYFHPVPAMATVYLGSIFGITVNRLRGCDPGRGLFQAGFLPGAQDPASASQSRGSGPGLGCAVSMEAHAAQGAGVHVTIVINPHKRRQVLFLQCRPEKKPVDSLESGAYLSRQATDRYQFRSTFARHGVT
jgi:hypothetical protein